MTVQHIGNTAGTDEVLLKIEDLWVSYATDEGRLDAVRNVSLRILKGEAYGIVGESGCGKSTLAYAIVGYLARNGRVSSGRILFCGENLLEKSERELRGIRGRRISMVYQEPYASLNPSIPVGEQIAEVLRTHLKLSRDKAWQRALDVLEKVRMPDPESVAKRYPHQISGGMQQRVLIAMALTTAPDLFILDEPTTALDVTTEAVILDLINELKEEFDSTIIYISHNLGVIARVCDRAAVMYAGEIVEKASIDSLFGKPQHPYTIALLRCVPVLGTSKESAKLSPIPGRVPSLPQLTANCSFEPRCSFAQEECRQKHPELVVAGDGHLSRCLFASEIRLERRHPLPAAITERTRQDLGALLSVRDLVKHFEERAGVFTLTGSGSARVKAVDGVSLELGQGLTLGLVGESGCGKTTIARCIVGLTESTSGRILFGGHDISRPVDERERSFLGEIQMVFQSADSTLNPRRTAGYTIGRALRMLRRNDETQMDDRIVGLLRAVRLDEDYKDRYPGQLSGGEKQRVAIARAFAGQPRLVVLDEPISSLDVSVQASIVNLLLELQNTLGTSYLFISHDLSVVRYLADYIGVVYLGRLCEVGPAEAVFAPPHHPYTEALLSAIPIPDPQAVQKRIRLEGPVPSAINPPRGCHFHTRCPRKMGEICAREEPPRVEAESGLGIFCHIPLDELCKLEPVTQV